MNFAEQDLSDLTEARRAPRVLDPVSAALGQAFFIRNHLPPDLRIETPIGRFPRMKVSRFYHLATPPVFVDFAKEIRQGKTEVRTKQTYCERRGIRYLLLADEFDLEGVRGVTSVEPETETEETSPPLFVKPLTAPRRRRPASREPKSE